MRWHISYIIGLLQVEKDMQNLNNSGHAQNKAINYSTAQVKIKIICYNPLWAINRDHNMLKLKYLYIYSNLIASNFWEKSYGESCVQLRETYHPACFCVCCSRFTLFLLFVTENLRCILISLISYPSAFSFSCSHYN